MKGSWEKLPFWIPLVFLAAACFCKHSAAQDADLAQSKALNARPLTDQGDLADRMLSGVDRFLLLQIDDARNSRSEEWKKLTEAIHHSDGSSTESPSQLATDWIALKREKLRQCLGLRDQRVSFSAIEILRTTDHSGVVGRGPIVALEPLAESGALQGAASALEGAVSALEAAVSALEGAEGKRWQAQIVRWPVLDGVHAEGLLIEPLDCPPTANVVVIPDADQTPEQLAGLSGNLPVHLQSVRILATAGCRVLVPTLISREVTARGPPGEPGRAELSNREFVYRPAFELGRHVVGYEIQKVLAAVDWFFDCSSPTNGDTPTNSTGDAVAGVAPTVSTTLGVVGFGEGGLIALCCAALDDRIQCTVVQGAFGPRERMWQEPICRNLFGLLSDFGDAELAALVWPRRLIVDFSPGPDIVLRTRGGAPGQLTPTKLAEATEEFRRATSLLGLQLIANDLDTSPPLAAVLAGVPESDKAFDQGHSHIATGSERTSNPVPKGRADWLFPPPDTSKPQGISSEDWVDSWSQVPLHLRGLLAPSQSLPALEFADPVVHPARRQARQVTQLIEHTQRLLAESGKYRDQMLKSLDTSSIQNYQQSTQAHRRRFYEEILGRFDEHLLPPEPRTRQSWETANWTGHEVVLDVWPNVIAYGVLLLPKNIGENEKRPVVVCQHGLEGRPTDVFLGDHPAYQDFAAKLCERGYIVFAPQNLYLMEDRFRTLQRKANSIGKSLFSIIIPQHQQILNWLKSLPQVDPSRMAFYGLSYGGKSAMRIPAVLEDYCLSICSADFNEWIIKNASTTEGFSYVWTGEYEIFEYNLGNTFGYAEMAALICPRPFMVERGHFDAVAVDPWVGYEFAKVRNLYQARLGIGDRTEIEWFVGPHTINGQGTFQFLDQHLQHSPH